MNSTLYLYFLNIFLCLYDLHSPDRSAATAPTSSDGTRAPSGIAWNAPATMARTPNARPGARAVVNRPSLLLLLFQAAPATPAEAAELLTAPVHDVLLEVFLFMTPIARSDGAVAPGAYDVDAAELEELALVEPCTRRRAPLGALRRAANEQSAESVPSGDAVRRPDNSTVVTIAARSARRPLMK